MNENLNRESAVDSLSHEVHCGTESPPPSCKARIVTTLSRFLFHFALLHGNKQILASDNTGQNKVPKAVFFL
jgi:hypothetical protein